MAVVYQHRRLDTNEVFYIGIGKEKKRAYIKSNRSKHWKAVIAKYGYEIDVLIDGCSWEDACEVEAGMIESYGRLDLGLGLLINLTDGGDGNSGKVLTEKQREEISNRQLGKKLKESHIKALSEAQKKYYASLTEEQRKKKCGTYGMLGKKQTQEHKHKIAEALKNKPRKKVACPHCAKEGGVGPMTRYHFDNCLKITGETKYKKMKDAKLIQCPNCNKIGSSRTMRRWHFDNCKNKI